MTAADDDALLAEPPAVEILTPRLRLRTLRVSDAERMMPILTSEAVMRWTVRHEHRASTIQTVFNRVL